MNSVLVLFIIYGSTKIQNTKVSVLLSVFKSIWNQNKTGIRIGIKSVLKSNYVLYKFYFKTGERIIIILTEIGTQYVFGFHYIPISNSVSASNRFDHKKYTDFRFSISSKSVWYRYTKTKNWQPSLFLSRCYKLLT